MNQQINFLKAYPKSAAQFPAKWAMLAGAALLGLLILISFFMGVHQIQSSLTAKHAGEEYSQVNAVLQQTKKEHPLLGTNLPVAEQVHALETELNLKKNYYLSLTRPNLRVGFSNYLYVLTKIVPEGVWLKEITIDQGINGTWLDGYMLNAAAVTRFLQALQDSTTFVGTSYHLTSVKKLPGKPYDEFKISNMGLDAKEPEIARDTPEK